MLYINDGYYKIKKRQAHLLDGSSPSLLNKSCGETSTLRLRCFLSAAAAVRLPINPRRFVFSSGSPFSLANKDGKLG